MKDNSRTRFPAEAASVMRKTKALTFALHQYPADPEKGDFPLRFYNGVSRISVTMIDKIKQKTVTGNISLEKFASIRERTKIALAKQVEVECGAAVTTLPPTENQDSPAFQVKIMMGEFKGKTPAEVLLEDPANAEKLNRHYTFLKGKLNEFPKNQTLMDAIMDAARLQQSGKLTASFGNQSTNSKQVITLYDTESRPLIRRKRDDGMCPVYEIKIVWEVGEKSPVLFTITNYYAPVERKPDGRLIVEKSKMDQSSRISMTMAITESEWMTVVENINTGMHCFKIIHAENLLQIAQEMYEEDRRRAIAAR